MTNTPTPALRFQAPPTSEWDGPRAVDLTIVEDDGVFYADLGDRRLAKSNDLAKLLHWLAAEADTGRL